MSDPLVDAKKAQERAQLGFLAAASRGPEVRELSNRVREHARRNHFGQGLDTLFRGGQTR